MEPLTSLPRRATTLTRLWRSTDAADSIAQFLPTEALPVLPNIAKTFERDHWRLLGALMRRAKRGTAAACKSAVLSTLQMTGRDSYHFREDWVDQARFSENWTVFGYRGYNSDGGEPESVEYTAIVSQGTLVLDRTTPKIRQVLQVISIFREPAIGAVSIAFASRFRILTTTKVSMVMVAVLPSLQGGHQLVCFLSTSNIKMVLSSYDGVTASIYTRSKPRPRNTLPSLMLR